MGDQKEKLIQLDPKARTKNFETQELDCDAGYTRCQAQPEIHGHINVNNNSNHSNDKNNNSLHDEDESRVVEAEPELTWIKMPKAGRVWTDGCFDMVHFGHANLLRQAKALGHRLTVGIHSDEGITMHKGPPVFTQDERCTMVCGIKWVDDVVLGAPYVTTVATLDANSCEFCSHGDDLITTADGADTYREVKLAKRYREVKRAQGVSTTDLVERMLKLTDTRRMNGDGSNEAKRSPYTGSTFLLTTEKLKQFNPDPIPAGATIVYVAGAFDILHPGHLHFLEKASKLGSHLIVGVHPDHVVEMDQGPGYPVMNLLERAYSLLAIKYVSDVVIGAPNVITKDLLENLNVSVVAHGKTPVPLCPVTKMDPYKLAKKLGIYREVDSGSLLTTEGVIQRIVARRPEYEARNRNKQLKEIALLEAEAERVRVRDEADANQA